MAPSDSITLRAQAKRLNVPNYRQMSLDELRAAVAKADGDNAEPSDNGAEATPSKRKGAAKRKGVAKKAAAKSAPAKSTKRKPAQRKSAAAKKGTAKRQTTGKRKPSTAKRAKRTSTVIKERTRKTNTAKRTVTRSKGTARRKTRAVAASNGDAGRHMIDATAIDWKADSPVGASGGNRGTIMKLLRRFKGNVQKVYDELADKAASMYPKTDDGRKRSKSEAQTLLRWHIGRTRYDFVKSSGQHPEADNPNYRKAARKRAKSDGSARPASTRRKPAQPRAIRRPATKRAGAQKPARGRSQAQKRANRQRGVAKRTANTRARTGATAASRKRKR